MTFAECFKVACRYFNRVEDLLARKKTPSCGDLAAGYPNRFPKKGEVQRDPCSVSFH